VSILALCSLTAGSREHFDAENITVAVYPELYMDASRLSGCSGKVSY